MCSAIHPSLAKSTSKEGVVMVTIPAPEKDTGRRIRTLMLVIVVAAATAFALYTAPRADAHSGYVSCSSLYEPDTWSNSSSADGTHIHGLVGTFSEYLLEGQTLTVHWWPMGGRFWNVNAPGTHTAWATCHFVGI